MFENTKNLLPTEFSTVTVTRKFYKSGESEYRLNDVSCRLKDIQNLFMDTGISTDSYAIIELGMVDDIIKDKDNSRRRMLEQAAGVTIYKTRKKEARQKLDATEQDLSRIEDLLFEINNQLKSLESQAKKAEKYFEIKKGVPGAGASSWPRRHWKGSTLPIGSSMNNLRRKRTGNFGWKR